jgi:hypothetical protein
MLDSALFIGGKCLLSNGSGKSPGLNQFAFGIKARLPCSSVESKNFRRPFPYFAQTTVTLHHFKCCQQVT